MATKTFDRVAPILVGDMMKLFGLADFQAAGYVGNFGHESGLVSGQQEGWPIGKVCPREDLLKYTGGIDWPQWTATRRRAFVDFINSRGLPYPSYLASLAFLRYELEGTHAHSVRQVKKTTTLKAAVETAEATYELAGVKAMSSRQAFAERALALYRAQSEPPGPIPDPDPVPTPVPLPDPKSPLTSKTNILAILSPVFTYLATVGLKWPNETQDLIATGVTAALGLLIAYFHSTQSQAVSTSPLAKDIEAAKEAQSDQRLQRRVDAGTGVSGSQLPQVPDRELAGEPLLPRVDVTQLQGSLFVPSSVALDKDGNIDLSRLTVAQLISIKRQLPVIMEPLLLNQKALPAPEPKSLEAAWVDKGNLP